MTLMGVNTAQFHPACDEFQLLSTFNTTYDDDFSCHRRKKRKRRSGATPAINENDVSRVRTLRKQRTAKELTTE